MRDQGLERAIGAAGGVNALARALGVSQPSVSNWERVPAERVLAVETLTGVSRSELRPDLYPAEAPKRDVDPLEAARATEYRLLSRLMIEAPASDLLTRLARITGDASPLGMAHVRLAAAASETDAAKASRAFFDLFIGVGRGEFLPYGSWYMTGFLHDKPLARLREDLARLGVVVRGERREPEDHIASVLDVMAAYATGELGDEPAPSEAEFFARHVEPWAARFFSELELSETSPFFGAVGHLGRVFLEIERRAFALAREAETGMRRAS